MPGQGSPADRWRLTTVEEEVWRLLADDLTDAEIAELRFVSIHTVKTQVRSILRKLAVANRRAAARLYRKSL